MFQSLSAAAVQGQRHLCSQQRIWMVQSVFCEDQQLHADVKRKRRSLLGGVSQELQPGQGFPKADNIGVTRRKSQRASVLGGQERAPSGSQTKFRGKEQSASSTKFGPKPNQYILGFFLQFRIACVKNSGLEFQHFPSPQDRETTACVGRWKQKIKVSEWPALWAAVGRDGTRGHGRLRRRAPASTLFQPTATSCLVLRSPQPRAFTKTGHKSDILGTQENEEAT